MLTGTGIRFLPVIAALLLPACPVVADAPANRAVFSEAAPQNLRAVGRLTVPGFDRVDGRRRHRDENCSASLIAADTILTAWHCLEYYDDLSRDPQFVLPYTPEAAPVAARRLADGGGMHADWALLRLSRPIRGVDPLPVKAFSSQLGTLLLAGYARDEALGAGGAHLTWQSGCRVLAREGDRLGTDCVTFKGASGGPVLAGPDIVGVISGGDSEARTYFVPSQGFLSVLRLHVRGVGDR